MMTNNSSINFYVYGILVNKSGKTVGARVSLNGHVIDLGNKQLAELKAKNPSLSAYNAFIDVNGFVRGKAERGVKYPHLLSKYVIGSKTSVQRQAIIYHGSNIVVSRPEVIERGNTKDFGYGFYVTKFRGQAEKWAKRKVGNEHIVSVYAMQIPSDARYKMFNDVNSEWIDFVMACRLGVKHDYDFVEGPVADDQIWNYVDDYLHGNISRLAFSELVKFRHQTNQILIANNGSIGKALRFQKGYRC